MKQLSTLAQLVALYAKHEGITKASELARLTGRSERHIWRAKAELTDAGVSDPDAGVRSDPDVCVSDPDAGVSHDPDVCVSDPDAGVRVNAPPPPKRKVSPCTPSKENTPPPQTSSITPFGRDGCATLEDSKSPPEEKNKSLPDLVAAAERAADPDDGDEGRYWAALGALATAGLPRSQLVKLGKLIGEHDEALAVFRSVAAARVPATYLAKIVRNREQETRQESLAMAGLLDEPEWVRGYRREGYSPIFKRPDGNWEISRWTFDAEGLEIGG